jgi:tetratricopeptide (TPR) repeat protein
MSRRSKQRPAAQSSPAPKRSARVWLFRLLAVALVPAVFLGLLEAGLRLVGYGISTSFLRSERLHDRDVFVPNLRVAERFFGKELARQPRSFLVDQEKPAGTIRIVVFGESAAFGDPDPDFGLSRTMRVLLEGRFAGRRFEVVNAAMTGINSHAILPIARDCLRLNADAWVVYMGNNEVVGPYGAGTVFGPQVPAMPLIRASLALKSTRTGQLLDELKSRLNPPPAQRSEWGGMTMFTENRVAEDDPRMSDVYANFERNLRDILKLAAAHDVPVVLSTVAVNLKDCAPFASVHRAKLGSQELAGWERQFTVGCAAQQAGDWAGALNAFATAASTDDRFAELHYRIGRCLMNLGRGQEAQSQLQKARDLDALRFRCDSRMNQILRDTAQHARGVALVDSARILDSASPGAIAGAELFYEHVHLRFEGNYLLARSLAEKVADQLPKDLALSSKGSWPTSEQCAGRLALADWNRHRADLTILARINDPPFTAQADQPEQLARLSREIQALEPATRPAALKALEPAYLRAIAAAPDDPVTEALHANALEDSGLATEAVAAGRRAADLDPFDPSHWEALGHYCSDAGLADEAIAALRKCLRLDPSNVSAANGLGQVLVGQKRFAEAADVFEAAIGEKPLFGQAQLGLGHALEGLGRTNEAKAHFEEALRHRILTPGGLGGLARFCYERGRYSEAVTNFLDAIRLDPSDAMLHLDLAQALKELGRTDEMRQHQAAALKLDPTSADAQFLVGLDLARAGDEAAGSEHFAEAVRLRPSFLEARLNYGLALYHLQRPADALEQFAAALKLDPSNPMAQKLAAALREPAK